ncbi:MAG TPA: hypothetical protein VL486_07730 [Verrucomicrobiae bacterium]|nr:hypothetical protein [Verrucomicrobiae bacterium]
MLRVIVSGVHKLDMIHASYVLAGLCELDRRGEIELQCDLHDGRNFWDGLTINLELQSDAGAGKMLCIDLRDRSDVANPAALERCDLYFRKSYYAPDLANLPEELRRKVRPLGLIFPCRSAPMDGLALRVLARKFGEALQAAEGRRLIRFPREAVGMVRWYLSVPLSTKFQEPPETTVDRRIVFQTRVWREEEVIPDSSTEVNELRAGVIRALRREFGARFQGGLIPTPYARQHYPDLVCTHRDARRRAYVAASKRSLIAVYTRGLYHCNAWKLGEYLAGSKCVVAEGLRDELPKPLREGTNYLGFGTPSECVDQCRRLLDDADLASSMRLANYQYYCEEVDPPSCIRKCLNRAYSHPEG